jgi:hypothetical protein
LENKKLYPDNLSREVNEESPGFINISEDEKLRENVFRPYIEKLHLFTRMIQREIFLKNAKTTQK